MFIYWRSTLFEDLKMLCLFINDLRYFQQKTIYTFLTLSIQVMCLKKQIAFRNT